jgi:hypothetical protein
LACKGDQLMIYETFSKRKRAASRGGVTDVYQYEVLPPPLRVQVVHIWESALGNSWNDEAEKRWKAIHNTIAREKGVHKLGKIHQSDRENCIDWITTAATDDALDLIEFSFRVIERVCGKLYDGQRSNQGITQRAGEAINELNHRFREHSVGYQFANGILVQVDSQFLHAEVVIPAISLLAGRSFATANDEFMNAHKHYRAGAYKECIVAANRAFESVMKAICTSRNWAFESGARASDLVSVLKTKGLFPEYLGKGLDTYIALLKTGLPAVRNNAGGHGDEPGAPPVAEHLAAYALHLSAANIVLLVEASQVQYA